MAISPGPDIGEVPRACHYSCTGPYIVLSLPTYTLGLSGGYTSRNWFWFVEVFRALIVEAILGEML